MWFSNSTVEYISKGNETDMSETTLISMYMAALFTIAKKLKQFMGPSTEKEKKTWAIYKMEYYSTIKDNGILLSHEENWNLIICR
jgi:hypothetical protein